MTDELRYAEWAVEATLAKEQANVVDAFGDAADPYAAKLLADVCGFLVTVARLDPDFRTFVRNLLAQSQPTHSRPDQQPLPIDSPASTPAQSESSGRPDDGTSALQV